MLKKKFELNNNFVILIKNYLKIKIVEGKIENNINFKFFKNINMIEKSKTVSLR